MIFYMFRESTNQQMVSMNGFETILLTHVNPSRRSFRRWWCSSWSLTLSPAALSPLTHGKVRGHRGKYHRLVYASNIPVILMVALLANINMFTLF